MIKLNLTNGFKLRKLSPSYSYFAYFDTTAYHADNLFIKHEVTIDFMREYSNDEWPYIFIIARCRKKDFHKAVAALNELPDKMLICGYRDYPDFCAKLIHEIENGSDGLRKKECVDNASNCTA